MKSEPSEFSIDDLATTKNNFWHGVRNYQVRNMFRDLMRVGDTALFYHSNTKNIGIVGEMEITKLATVDDSQFDISSKYYDAKSTLEKPRWLAPTVTFVKKFNKIVTLEILKSNSLFSELPLIKKGNRLSVLEITHKHYEAIIRLSK